MSRAGIRGLSIAVPVVALSAVGALAFAAPGIAGEEAVSETADVSAKAQKAPPTYEIAGPLDTGGTVTMFVHMKNTPNGLRPNYIGAMFASEVDFSCTEGPLADQSISTQADIKIKADRTFKYNFVSFEAQFKGRVARSGKKASGTVSYGPDDDPQPGYTNCVLPGSPVPFTAEK